MQVINARMSPLELRILLHHYYTIIPWNEPSSAAEIAHNAHLEDGLLTYMSSRYKVTEKGLCLLYNVLNTPMPTPRCGWKVVHKKRNKQ
jgi:hypothetical protein